MSNNNNNAVSVVINNKTELPGDKDNNIKYNYIDNRHLLLLILNIISLLFLGGSIACIIFSYVPSLLYYSKILFGSFILLLLMYISLCVLTNFRFNKSLPDFEENMLNETEGNEFYNNGRNAKKIVFKIKAKCFKIDKDDPDSDWNGRLVSHEDERTLEIPCIDTSPSINPSVTKDPKSEILFCRNYQNIQVDDETQLKIDEFIKTFRDEKVQIDQQQLFYQQAIIMDNFDPDIVIKRDNKSSYLSYTWSVIFRLLCLFYCYAKFVESRMFKCDYTFIKYASYNSSLITNIENIDKSKFKELDYDKKTKEEEPPNTFMKIVLTICNLFDIPLSATQLSYFAAYSVAAVIFYIIWGMVTFVVGLYLLITLWLSLTGRSTDETIIDFVWLLWD